jgi:rod shape determining protein RodA
MGRGEKRNWRSYDPFLLLATLALGVFGVAMIYSATSATSGLGLNSPAVRQGLMLLAGLAVMALATFIDYRIYGALAGPLYVLTLALLAVVLVAGRGALGAQRWLQIGPLDFQPSEFGKLLFVLVLAKYLADREQHITQWRTFLLSIALAGVPMVLIYRQPDLGTTMVFAFIWLSMVAMAGARPLHLLATGVTALAAAPLAWHLLHGYMRGRLLIFLDPQRDPLGAGYNIIQSRISVGSGGLWGKGFLQGSQTQLNYLRVRHTDFIFSVVAEELGFVGSMALLGLYLVLLGRCLRVISIARDAYGRLVATGISAMLFFQIFVNVGMNVGLMPVTGIPLPLVSYGRSSFLTILIGLGILQSILVNSQPGWYEPPPLVRVPSWVRLRRPRVAP